MPSETEKTTTDSESRGNRAAYVILSHRFPEHVQRLAHRVLELSPEARVLILHDSRRSPAPTSQDPRVHVTANVREADWGSWDLVLASLDALRGAADLFDPDLLVLMSGQDYPARNLAEWEHEFFDRNGGWVGDVWELDYRPKWGRPYGVGDDDLTRYIYRWYRVPFAEDLVSPRSRALRAFKWALAKAGHYFEPVLDVREVTRGRGVHVGLRSIRTPFTNTNPCMRGSQWLAVDREMFEALSAAHDEDKRMRATYRRSIIPDESYFQTILSRIGRPQEGHPLTYVRWIVEDDAPKTLTLSDLEAIRASSAPLCRKVVPGPSDELLDALDSMTSRPSGIDAASESVGNASTGE